MKRLLLSISVVLLGFSLFGQQFNDFFINQTLRIDYLHIGNSDSNRIEIASLFTGGTWNGTHTSLIEPNRYGDVLFEVFDAESDQLIFSRSYSCLFNEYRTTERAETEIGHFEECVLLPFPKKSITYQFTSYDRKKVAQIIGSGTFNPDTDAVTPFKKEYKIMTLHKSNAPEKALDILFIPDGYSKADKKTLRNDMKRFASYILGCSPFKESGYKINIRAIEGYSEESGITDPNNEIVKNTLLGSSYNVIDVDRYLMCLNVWKMHEIADDAPYDVIVIVANSKKYGGGGIYNFYCTVNNTGERADYVIVHELGHLIGGLGDEYFTSEVSVRDYYPVGVEPVEPNLTTLTDFESKWKSMMDAETPIPTPDARAYQNVLGVYEGGGYVAEGVFRPWRDCTMKEPIYNHFCPVCSKTLLEVIDYYAK